MRSQSGFTLIELMMTLIIVTTLSTIVYPVFDEQLEKSALAELVLRIDAMRTSATTSIEAGDDVVLNFSKTPIGQIPAELTGVISDSMQYPGLDLLLARSSKDFQQFQGGIDRPYLIIFANNSDSIGRLRALSDILPERIRAWWMPSVALVVPLVDDQFLPGAASRPSSLPSSGGSGASSSGGGASGGASSSGTATSGGTSGSGTATSTPPQSASTPATASSSGATGSGNSGSSLGQSGSSPGNSGSAPGHNHHTACTHPGNGHAFGRCSH